MHAIVRAKKDTKNINQSITTKNKYISIYFLLFQTERFREMLFKLFVSDCSRFRGMFRFASKKPPCAE